MRYLRGLSLGAALDVEALGVVALCVEPVNLVLYEPLVLLPSEALRVTPVDVVSLRVVAVREESLLVPGCVLGAGEPEGVASVGVVFAGVREGVTLRVQGCKRFTIVFKVLHFILGIDGILEVFRVVLFVRRRLLREGRRACDPPGAGGDGLRTTGVQACLRNRVRFRVFRGHIFPNIFCVCAAREINSSSFTVMRRNVFVAIEATRGHNALVGTKSWSGPSWSGPSWP